MEDPSNRRHRRRGIYGFDFPLMALCSRLTDFHLSIVTSSVLSSLEDSLLIVTNRREKPVLTSFLTSRAPRSKELTTLSSVLRNNRQKNHLNRDLSLNFKIRSR